MEVVICSSPTEVGHIAAAKVARVLRDAGPRATLGVATGSSPLALYEALAHLVANGPLDLRHIEVFALDEYVGLPPRHPQSYAAVIDATVTRPLGLDPRLVHTPDGSAEDLDEAAQHYERQIRAAGGVDVQILGIGANGHIGFNEPTSSLASRTRIKTLASATRHDNARFFPTLADVPTHCITQGLGTILDAGDVVLVAQGSAKAHAIAQLVEGPITAMCPGSVLQLHPKATIIVDEAAAAELSLADYYRMTFDNKPDWQRYHAGD